MFGRKTALGLLTGTLATTAVVGGGAAVWAASAKPTQGGGTIQACVGRHGALRLALRDGCHGPEKLISWSVEGPAGAAGTPGVAGPPGPSLNLTVDSDVLGANFPVTQVAAAVPLSVTLPTPGTYLLSANVRGIIAYATPTAPHNCRIEARLRTGATNIPDSFRLVVNDANDLPAHRSAVEATAPIQVIYTGAAGDVVTLWAATRGQTGNGNCAAATLTAIGGGSDGQSTLNAVRIQ